MTNKERRQIVDKAKAEGFQGNYVDLFKQADAQRGKPMVAETPQQKAEGLRPAHKAGNTNASMVFKDVPPHTPFNTVGMKAPISLKKYDERGELVKSFDSIPPGIRSFDTGPGHGKVVEGPARAQNGKFKEAVADPTKMPTDTKPKTDNAFLRAMREHNMKEDSTFENTYEAFDMSGVSSWDDAYRAYKSMRARDAYLPNLDEGLDMAGVIPGVSSGKMAYNLAKYSVTPAKYLAKQALNYAKAYTGRAASAIDAVEDETGFLDKKKRGGFRKAQGGTATQAATAVMAGQGEDSVGSEVSTVDKALDTAGSVIGFYGKSFLNPLGAAGVLGGMAIDKAKDRVLENIQPYGYVRGAGPNDPTGTIERLYSAVIDNQPEAYSKAGNEAKGNRRTAQMKERTDLFALNLGKEQPYGTLVESEYRPTNSTDDDAVYYRSPVTESYLKRQIELGKNPEDVAGVDYHESGRGDNTLGNYTITLGEDEEGKYYSYYDVWDLNPFSQGNPAGAAVEAAANWMLGNKPPEVYGRVYYKRKKLGGYRLPSYRK